VLGADPSRFIPTNWAFAVVVKNETRPVTTAALMKLVVTTLTVVSFNIIQA
jgi:hypothetical protein